MKIELTVKKEFDVKFLHVIAEVRYCSRIKVHQMKTIKTNNRTLLFVEVPSPSDGGGFRIESNTFRYEQYGWKGWRTESKELPSGNYRLIATTDTITEEQADKIIERSKFNKQLYRNYQFEGVESFAIDGFTSLLRTHSITGRHAIIEVL